MNFILSPSTLSLENLEAVLNDVQCGGVVVFCGHVRNYKQGREVVALEFDAYDSMAIKELEIIADEIRMKWPVKKIALHHRIGRVEAGQTAVIAGVAAPHRAEAFAACEYLMNRLKQSVPIWKKEIFKDGEVWVTPTP